MLTRVPEGAGHAATPGVEIDNVGRWDAREELARRRRNAHGFLVAVAMKVHSSRAGAQREPNGPARPLALEMILKQHRGLRHDFRFAPRVASQESRCVFADS